jgi:hypothetical protein
LNAVLSFQIIICIDAGPLLRKAAEFVVTPDMAAAVLVENQTTTQACTEGESGSALFGRETRALRDAQEGRGVVTLTKSS